MMRRGSNKFNLKILRFFDQKGLGSIFRTFLSSLLVISFFYSIPTIAFYLKNNSIVFENNSKAVLAYTLNNNGKTIEDGLETLDENDLLVDIFSLNDLETDSVRLNASTIKQLFEDTNYSLKDVREKKLVKPVALT